MMCLFTFKTRLIFIISDLVVVFSCPRERKFLDPPLHVHIVVILV